MENSKFAESAASPFSVPVSYPMPNTSAVPSTFLADPVDTHAHAPTQIDEIDQEAAVDTQSDDPFQFEDPPVTAPLILPQRNSGYDHRDLPHHIRTKLQQSRIRKPAQSLKPDAKRLRLDAGKRPVLMLSHDVSFGPECCRSITVFKSCRDSEERANVLFTGRAVNKEVLYDVLTQSQQESVNAATTREWDKWNEFGVTKFSVQEAAERHHEAKPRSEDCGNQMGADGESY